MNKLINILDTVINGLTAAAGNITTATDIIKAGADRVRQASGRILLSDLRAAVDMSREQFDTIILQMEDDRTAVLYGLDNPTERTADVMAGGVEVFPGLFRQIMYL